MRTHLSIALVSEAGLSSDGFVMLSVRMQSNLWAEPQVVLSGI